MKEGSMNVEQIARICHETNKYYCHSIGDHSQKSWDRAEEWQRQSAVKGVEFALANPGARASAQHDAWLADKEADGWKFGPVKDPAKKEHPCMVPYAELPIEQRIKDHLFRGIVGAFIASLGEPEVPAAETETPVAVEVAVEPSITRGHGGMSFD